MKLKGNVLKIILGISLIIGLLSGKVLATSKSNANNALTEEKVQTIVQEQVTSAVQGAVEEFKAEEAAKEAEKETQTQEENKANGIGLIAAAIATGLACIGSGIAVAVVASSAVGAISENPKLLGKTVIFAGLAEGIAIYGLIISIMILNKI